MIRRGRTTWSLLLAAMVLSACGSGEPEVPADAAPSVLTPTPSRTPTPSPLAPSVDDVRLALEVVATGFDQPVLALPRPGSNEVWVLEQPGRIRRMVNGEVTGTVADLRSSVRSGGERGLLGLAFSPDHASTGEFVVHYSSQPDGDTRIERWRVSGASASADGVVIEVDQPAGNHNGGMIQFGPDGMLHVSLGDGGGGGDRYGNGQRPDTLLGAILRLDLSSRPYAIPADNPWVSGGEGAPEVWAYGVRNPWRTWIHGSTMFVADVGQDAVEEITVLPLSTSGANLQWPTREGSRCFQASPCSDEGRGPTVEYTHGPGCTVIGGMVSTGDVIPGLDGHYFYSDLCAGFLRSFRMSGGSAVEQRDWSEQVGGLGTVLSFGKDAAGHLLVLSADGTIRRIVAA